MAHKEVKAKETKEAIAIPPPHCKGPLQRALSTGEGSECSPVLSQSLLQRLVVFHSAAAAMETTYF